MSGTKRRPVVLAEATQELQAADVLEVLGTGALSSDATKLPAARKPFSSQSSIAPVGLDLMDKAEVREEEINPTMEVRLPVRRRRLGKVVAVAVGACALILVAAGVARVGRASDEPAKSAASAPAPSPTVTSTGASTSTSAPAAVPSPTAAVAPIGATGPGASSTSTGTVHLVGRAATARVWLDGKKLTTGTTSALLSCGTHKIKVSGTRAHSIDVPCGGSVDVPR
jgi:hypothetical protein